MRLLKAALASVVLVAAMSSQAMAAGTLQVKIFGDVTAVGLETQVNDWLAAQDGVRVQHIDFVPVDYNVVPVTLVWYKQQGHAPTAARLKLLYCPTGTCPNGSADLEVSVDSFLATGVEVVSLTSHLYGDGSSTAGEIIGVAYKP